VESFDFARETVLGGKAKSSYLTIWTSSELSVGAIVRLNTGRSRDGDEDEGGRGVGLGVSRNGGGGGTGARRVSIPRCMVSSSKRPRKDVGRRAEGLTVGTASNESFGNVSGGISAFNAA
jgi:hypothetical protein